MNKKLDYEKLCTKRALNSQKDNYMHTSGTRISNFIIGAILFSVSLIIWIGGKELYGSDATLLWASGILTVYAIYPLVDAFRGIKK